MVFSRFRNWNCCFAMVHGFHFVITPLNIYRPRTRHCYFCQEERKWCGTTPNKDYGTTALASHIFRHFPSIDYSITSLIFIADCWKLIAWFGYHNILPPALCCVILSTSLKSFPAAAADLTRIITRLKILRYLILNNQGTMAQNTGKLISQNALKNSMEMNIDIKKEITKG